MDCPVCSRSNTPGARFCVFCGAALDVPRSLGGVSETAFDAPSSLGGAPPQLIGEVLLDRYRIASLIGEGATSFVYLAEQRIGNTARPVAVKVLTSMGALDEHIVARFRQECELLISLSHPNTIQVYDFGELPNGMLFIVMEYVDGAVPLSQVIPLPEDRALHVISQVASALHEAHCRKVIHRDLKPDNILISIREGQRDFVKVLDFGIAKRLSENRSQGGGLTQEGMVLGTPPYMSPEQFSGSALDARSDLYSLAVVSYELLTGALPFEANTPWAWAHQHMTVDPKPIEEQPNGPSISKQARHAIHRALAKSPGERQPDVASFVRELTLTSPGPGATVLATVAERGVYPAEAHAAPASLAPPSLAPAPSGIDPRPPILTRKRSRRWPWLLALLVGASGAALATLSWLGARGARRAPPLPSPTLVVSTDPDAAAEAASVNDRDVRGFESVHHVSKASNAQFALGARDAKFAEVWAGGRLTLEFGQGREIRADGTKRADVRVYAAGGDYEVQVSEDHHRFHTVSKQTGRATLAEIDLDQAPVKTVRFVSILNQAARATVRVDAVEVEASADAPSRP